MACLYGVYFCEKYFRNNVDRVFVKDNRSFEINDAL